MKLVLTTEWREYQLQYGFFPLSTYKLRTGRVRLKVHDKKDNISDFSDKQCILDSTQQGVNHPCSYGSNCPTSSVIKIHILPFSCIALTFFLFFSTYVLFSKYSIVYLIIIINFNLYHLYFINNLKNSYFAFIKHAFHLILIK